MKNLRIITAAILLLFFGTTLVYAQGAGNEWNILNREVMNLYRQGKYDRADVVAQKALEVAEQNVGPDHPDVGKSLNNLAVLYYAHGNNGECDVVEQSMSMSGLDSNTFSVSAQATLGPSDEPLLGELNGDDIVDADDRAILDSNYYTRGGMTPATGDMDGDGDIDDVDVLRFIKAERAYRAHSFGAVATTSNCDLAFDDYTKAEVLYNRSLAITEKAFGSGHPTVATIRTNLAVLHYTQGDFAKAEPLLRRSLAIRGKSLGTDNPDVATSLNNLASLYQTQGDYAKAEILYKRSLAIREKAFGPDHPSMATSLNNLAELYRTQTYYTKAEPLFKRSLAIRGKSLGPDHPILATSLINLAVLYYTQGDYAKAEPLLKRSMAIREKAFGPNHPYVGVSLSNLAGLYRATKQIEEAEKLERRATQIRAMKR